MKNEAPSSDYPPEPQRPYGLFNFSPLPAAELKAAWALAAERDPARMEATAIGLNSILWRTAFRHAADTNAEGKTMLQVAQEANNDAAAGVLLNHGARNPAAKKTSYL